MSSSFDPWTSAEYYGDSMVSAEVLEHIRGQQAVLGQSAKRLTTTLERVDSTGSAEAARLAAALREHIGLVRGVLDALSQDEIRRRR